MSRPVVTRATLALAVFGLAAVLGLTAAAALEAQPAGPRPPVRLRSVGVGPLAGTAEAVVVDAGALVHTAALLPEAGPGGSVVGGLAAQVADVLDRLDVALAAAGTSLGSAVRLHVYMTDAAVTPAVERALEARVGGASHRPAVTLVETRLPLAGARVAMDVVAATAQPVPAGRPMRLVVEGLAPAVGGGAHVAIQPAGPFVAVSGRAAPGPFVEGIRGTLDQLRADLTGAGLGVEHVVHIKSFLGDMSRAAELQALVAEAFPGIAPPQTVTEWVGTTVPAEIELIAVGPAAPGPGGGAVSFTEPIASRFSRVARVGRGQPIYVSGLSGTSADPAAQIDEIFAALRRLASATGSDLRHLVKATYYVSDPAADQRINTIRPGVYAEDAPPAASKIAVAGVGRAGLGATIDMIMVTRTR